MRRILWFAPLPPAETDIANYTARLAPFLTREADILFCFPDDNPGPVGLPAKPIGQLSVRECNQADVCFYHMGNNVEFHGQIFDHAQRYPGVVVLHDRAIHEFYMGYLKFWSGGAGVEEVYRYSRAMSIWYGQEGFEASQAILSGRKKPADCSERFPLYEEAVVDALGAITHNSAVAEELRDFFPLLPIFDLRLPYSVPATTPRLSGRNDRKHVYKLVAFGFIGGNRRLLQFLHAWACSPWRNRFELDVAGRLFDAAPIESFLSKSGLAERVRMRGFISDEALDALLQGSDLALNLRYPTMGEASGSQLRIWANGVPSVVTDVGWYSQLAGDSVIKIRPPDAEHKDLLALLKKVAEGQIDLDALAKAGWKEVKRHAPELYVQNLLEWISKGLSEASFDWMMRRSIDRIAREHAAITAEGDSSGLNTILRFLPAAPRP